MARRVQPRSRRVTGRATAGHGRHPNLLGYRPAVRWPTIVGMSIDDNKAVVRKFIDALFTDGDLGATDEYLASDFVNHDPPIGVSPAAEGMRSAGAMFRRASPTGIASCTLVVEDDIVVERFTASGTHRGEIMGVAPTGKVVVLKGINIFRLRDGQITFVPSSKPPAATGPRASATSKYWLRCSWVTSCVRRSRCAGSHASTDTRGVTRAPRSFDTTDRERAPHLVAHGPGASSGSVRQARRRQPPRAGHDAARRPPHQLNASPSPV